MFYPNKFSKIQNQNSSKNKEPFIKNQLAKIVLQSHLKTDIQLSQKCQKKCHSMQCHLFSFFHFLTTEYAKLSKLFFEKETILLIIPCMFNLYPTKGTFFRLEFVLIFINFNNLVFPLFFYCFM